VADDPVVADGVAPEVLVAAGAAAAKADGEVLVLDVGDVLAITTWFVVASGSNARQVKAAVDEVELQVAEAVGRRPRRVEGLDTAEWVLMDYGDFVVHVFLDETRRHYEIERLYQDVPRVPWERDVTPR
jgi:ribosome-associated protein